MCGPFRVEQESEVTDKELMQLQLKPGLLVACIYRGGKVIIPNGRDCIQKGDSVVIVTTQTGLNDLTDILA